MMSEIRRVATIEHALETINLGLAAAVPVLLPRTLVPGYGPAWRVGEGSEIERVFIGVWATLRVWVDETRSQDLFSFEAYSTLKRTRNETFAHLCTRVLDDLAVWGATTFTPDRTLTKGIPYYVPSSPAECARVLEFVARKYGTIACGFHRAVERTTRLLAPRDIPKYRDVWAQA